MAAEASYSLNICRSWWRRKRHYCILHAQEWWEIKKGRHGGTWEKREL